MGMLPKGFFGGVRGGHGLMWGQASRRENDPSSGRSVSLMAHMHPFQAISVSLLTL